jgi:hypothetical protein
MIVDTLDELDARWFTAALRAGGVLGDDDRVVAVRSQAFGTGQFGMVVRSELEYAGDDAGGPASVMVKLPSADETIRQFAIAVGSYAAEVRFYRELAPRVDVATPRVYWGESEDGTGRFTLLLEDLSGVCQVGDMVGGGSKEQASAVLAQLVGLQAPLWDDRSLRDLAWLAAPTRTRLIFDAVAPCLPAFRERFGPRLDPAHVDLFERIAPRASGYVDRAWRGPMVVMHGDFRLDNVLFSEASGQLRATVIDWQGACLGPPLVDVATYLATCLSPADRRAHEQELLHGYHQGLIDAGIRDFSFAQCWEAYRQASLYMCLGSVAGSVTLKRSERGDAMFTAMAANTADLVLDLDAEGFLA